MSEVRFYLDEHVAKAVASGLRLQNIDVMTSMQAGNLGVDDKVHLDFALAGHRVIFSQDADFLSLAGQGHAHSGIAYARQHTSIGNIIGGLVLIHQVLSAEDMNGRIEYI